MTTINLTKIDQKLVNFALLDNFWQQFNFIFGTQYNVDRVEILRQEWLARNFAQLPPIEIISSDILGNTLGGYSASKNTIYLADRFLATATQEQIEAVILEEIGHFIDAHINLTDTLGDEGELFSKIVLGKPLTPEQIINIQQEDDFKTITIEEQILQIEQATGIIITETGGNTIVTEGGATDSYSIVLSSQPTANVTININSGSQLSTNSNQITFTPQNWNIAQIVTVTAVDDAVFEDNHSGTIQHTVTSTDTNYNGLSISPINVSITDNDSSLNKIHEVQGSGSSTPLIGQTVTIEGVVIADFQLSNQLRGFFIQEEDTDRDANSATSEGIFVFTGNNPPLDVQEGQIIRLTGNVSEFFNMTQITATTAGSITLVNGGNNLSLVTRESIDLPVTGDINTFYEQYEGMLVTYSDKMYVSEYNDLARYGQIVLTADGRPYQYTHTDNTPTSAEYTAFLDDLARKRIILDDDDNTQNTTLNDGIGKIFYPQPGGLSTGTQGTNYFRGGDTISNLTGVLHWSFAGQSGTDAWRLRPTQANPITFTTENPRPATPPTVGGNIKVATFNVFDYFNTIDTVGGSGSPLGADSMDEFNRQNEKIISALIGLNADVIGLIEIENNGNATTPAVKELVDRLNAQVGAGIYNYINTGLVGTDQTTVAIIYKTSVVTAKGNVAILDNTAFTDPNNTGQQRNRPSIAQTFQVIDNNNQDFGAVFNLVVNHFKSKNTNSATGNDIDQNDGQGGFNDTRTKAANYLVNTWIPSDPTGQGDNDFLLIGDLNAYKGETPITTIKNAGYTDLVESYNGNNAYGYVLDGQLGYLDYALSNGSMTSQVTGVAKWHINADEIPLFDYNNTVDDGSGEASFEAKPTGNNLYEPNAFRTSDHDPVIIGLNLSLPNQSPTDINLSNNSIPENSSPNSVVGNLSTTDADTGNTFTYSLVSGTGDTDNNTFAIVGNQLQIQNSPDFETKNSYSIRVSTTDNTNLSYEKVFTINISNENETPTVANFLQNQTTIENTLYHFAIPVNTFVDEDSGDFLTYTATLDNGNPLPPWLTFNDVNNTFSGTPTINDLGTINVKVTATDKGLLSTSDIFSLTVQSLPILRVRGTTANDTLVGGLGYNSISGDGGNDSITGNIVVDSLMGGSGNDTLKGLEGNDFLDGGSGNDRLKGGEGNDILMGGSNNDTLIGGMGNDNVSGGSGVDYFIFNSPSEGVDRIIDFSIDDYILLQGNNFNLSTWSEAQFVISSSGATQGSHRIIYNPHLGTLFFDADGVNNNSSAIQIAQLNSRMSLTYEDFVII